MFMCILIIFVMLRYSQNLISISINCNSLKIFTENIKLLRV